MAQHYDITSATALKTTPGTLVTVSVIVAGTTLGTANDAATTGAAAVTNQIAAIPNTAGTVLQLQWPCATGIVLVPGTGQTLAAFTL